MLNLINKSGSDVASLSDPDLACLGQILAYGFPVVLPFLKPVVFLCTA